MGIYRSRPTSGLCNPGTGLRSWGNLAAAPADSGFSINFVKRSLESTREPRGHTGVEGARPSLSPLISWLGTGSLLACDIWDPQSRRVEVKEGRVHHVVQVPYFWAQCPFCTYGMAAWLLDTEWDRGSKGERCHALGGANKISPYGVKIPTGKPLSEPPMRLKPPANFTITLEDKLTRMPSRRLFIQAFGAKTITDWAFALAPLWSTTCH